MNKFALLLAIMLFLASPVAWAEADSSADLRYCLDLGSNDQIARCAGEVSPGNKGRPLSKEEVQKILDKRKASAPVSANDSAGAPSTIVDSASNGPVPEITENNNN